MLLIGGAVSGIMGFRRGLTPVLSECPGVAAKLPPVTLLFGLLYPLFFASFSGIDITPIVWYIVGSRVASVPRRVAPRIKF